MSRFLQVYEPDTGLMLTQESIDFMMGKCEPEFIIATEGFGDIMKKIWDAIVKFFKWVLEKLRKLYDSMKEMVKKLNKKKEEIKEAQKEKEQKALNKTVNDTVGGHEKAASELTDETRKSADKMKKVMSDADKKSSGGLKSKDYYEKRREEAHKDFKKADADMKDNLDKTAKATAKVHDAATGKQEEPAKKEEPVKKEQPKEEPKKEEPKKEEPAKEEPKNEAVDVDGLIYNFNGSDFEKALDAGLKGLEKITLMCKKILDNIKVDRSDPEKTVNSNADDCFEPIFKIINDIFERYKVREHTDAKWGSGKDGNNSMHFENVDELSKLIEKRLMPGCKNLHKMLNKIILFLDTVSSKDTLFYYSLSQKYGEYARKLDDSKLTDHDRELRATFIKLRRSFKSIAECATRIYNAISHDYHKMNSAVMKIKFG